MLSRNFSPYATLIVETLKQVLSGWAGGGRGEQPSVQVIKYFLLTLSLCFLGRSGLIVIVTFLVCLT